MLIRVARKKYPRIFSLRSDFVHWHQKYAGYAFGVRRSCYLVYWMPSLFRPPHRQRRFYDVNERNPIGPKRSGESVQS